MKTSVLARLDRIATRMEAISNNIEVIDSIDSSLTDRLKKELLNLCEIYEQTLDKLK